MGRFVCRPLARLGDPQALLLSQMTLIFFIEAYLSSERDEIFSLQKTCDDTLEQGSKDP